MYTVIRMQSKESQKPCKEKKLRLSVKVDKQISCMARKYLKSNFLKYILLHRVNINVFATSDSKTEMFSRCAQDLVKL